MTDGATLETSVAVPRGAPSDPLSPDEVLAKFHRCAAVSAGKSQAEEIAELCIRLDRLADIRELTALLAAR